MRVCRGMCLRRRLLMGRLCLRLLMVLWQRLVVLHRLLLMLLCCGLLLLLLRGRDSSSAILLMGRGMRSVPCMLPWAALSGRSLAA